MIQKNNFRSPQKIRRSSGEEPVAIKTARKSSSLIVRSHSKSQIKPNCKISTEINAIVNGPKKKPNLVKRDEAVVERQALPQAFFPFRKRPGRRS